MTDVHGIAVAGATFPAHIWASFMRNVLSNPAYACPLSDYPLPANPVVWKPFSSAFTQYAPTPTTDQYVDVVDRHDADHPGQPAQDALRPRRRHADDDARDHAATTSPTTTSGTKPHG